MNKEELILELKKLQRVISCSIFGIPADEAGKQLIHIDEIIKEIELGGVL